MKAKNAKRVAVTDNKSEFEIEKAHGYFWKAMPNTLASDGNGNLYLGSLNPPNGKIESLQGEWKPVEVTEALEWIAVAEQFSENSTGFPTGLFDAAREEINGLRLKLNQMLRERESVAA